MPHIWIYVQILLLKSGKNIVAKILVEEKNDILITSVENFHKIYKLEIKDLELEKLKTVRKILELEWVTNENNKV